MPLRVLPWRSMPSVFSQVSAFPSRRARLCLSDRIHRSLIMRLIVGIVVFVLSAHAQTAEDKIRTELERSQKILKDWANLTRYKTENTTLAAPTTGEARVVFMGDSITDAWG